MATAQSPIDLKENLYSILGIQNSASDAEIRQAYRIKALAHHPDKNRGKSDLAEEQMKKINKAYNVLIDSAKRRDYNDKLEEQDEADVSSFAETFGHLHVGPLLSDKFKELIKSAKEKYKGLKQESGKAFWNKMRTEITKIYDEVRKTLTDIAPNGVPKFQDLDSSSTESNLSFRLSTAYRLRDYDSLVTLILEAYYKNFINCLTDLIDLQVKYEDKLPISDKAILLMTRGVREILLDKVVAGLQLLHEAILTWPNADSIISAITWILIDPFLNCVMRQKICKELNQLATIASNREHNITLIDSLLLSNNLTIATSHRYQSFLKSTPALRSVTKCERGILRELKNKSLDSAFWYLDLVMAAPDASTSVSCFLMAGLLFLQYLKQCDNNAEKYAIKCAIFECFEICVAVSQHMHPAMQIYVRRIALSACWETTTLVSSFLCSTSDANLIATMLSRCSYLLTIFPICTKDILLSSDVLYLNAVDVKLLQTLLSTLWYTDCPTVGEEEVSYFAFEGSWRGWFSLNEDEIEFEEPYKMETLGSRFEAMDQLLLSQNHSWSDVEDNLNWAMISRNQHGWIDRRKPWLNGAQFSKVHGFEIDLKDGTLKFFLEESRRYPRVISWNDIREVFSSRVDASIFSLDEPNPKFFANPFQQIRFAPAELSGTNFLATLLHTDYLLKCFTVGVEVSGYAPFPIQPISEDNLFYGLPDKLRKVLRSVSSRKSGGHVGQAHRFWIEAGKIPIEQKQENNKLTVRLGDVPMCVKKHLLIRNSNGELEDAPNDDPKDCSAEAMFARDFTEHYDQIGLHFPEFLRLKELLKLAAIQTIISNVEQSRKVSNEFLENLKEFTDSIVKQFDQHPLIQNFNLIDSILTKQLSECKRRVMNEYGYSSWTQSIENAARETIREQIMNAFQKLDTDLVSSVKNQIIDALGVSPANLESSIVESLEHKNSNILFNCLSAERLMAHRKLQDHLKKLNYSENKSNQDTLEAFPSKNHCCKWVPTAFCTDEKGQNVTYMVVGGVNLSIKLRHTTVPQNGKPMIYSDDSGYTKGTKILTPPVKMLEYSFDVQTNEANKNWMIQKIISTDCSRKNKSEIPQGKSSEEFGGLARSKKFAKWCGNTVEIFKDEGSRIFDLFKRRQSVQKQSTYVAGYLNRYRQSGLKSACFSKFKDFIKIFENFEMSKFEDWIPASSQSAIKMPANIANQCLQEVVDHVNQYHSKETEIVIRQILDELIFPLAAWNKNIEIVTEEGCKRNEQFPGAQCDYMMKSEGIPIGFIEAKTRNTFNANSLSQLIITILRFAEKYKDQIKQSINRPILGILTDSYKLIFLKFEHNTCFIDSETLILRNDDGEIQNDQIDVAIMRIHSFFDAITGNQQKGNSWDFLKTLIQTRMISNSKFFKHTKHISKTKYQPSQNFPDHCVSQYVKNIISEFASYFHLDMDSLNKKYSEKICEAVRKCQNWTGIFDELKQIYDYYDKVNRN